MRYIISYDLNTPGQNYEPLWEALREIGAQRILQSQWIARRINTNAENLRNYIDQHLDANDGILVTCLDNADWASRGVMVNPNSV